MFAKAAAKKAAIQSNEPSPNKPVKIETEENLMLQSHIIFFSIQMKSYALNIFYLNKGY